MRKKKEAKSNNRKIKIDLSGWDSGEFWPFDLSNQVEITNDGDTIYIDLNLDSVDFNNKVRGVVEDGIKAFLQGAIFEVLTSGLRIQDSDHGKVVVDIPYKDIHLGRGDHWNIVKQVRAIAAWVKRELSDINYVSTPEYARLVNEARKLFGLPQTTQTDVIK